MSDTEIKALLVKMAEAQMKMQEDQQAAKVAADTAAAKLAEQQAETATLLATQRREQEDKLAAERERADAKLEQLIASIQAPGPITLKPPDPDADAVRAEKVQKINFNLRRSQRLKPYKVSADTDIKLFLKKFEEELKGITRFET